MRACMNLKLRRGTAEDAERCGTICYEAFKSISEAHAFPPDFPSAEVAIGLLTRLLSDPRYFSVVAELDGRVVGSNFLDERNVIGGVGPITIDPAVQNQAIGRALMEEVNARAASHTPAGVRLLQAGYHGRSLSLYTKLGYDVRESLVCLQGRALNASVTGWAVRPAQDSNVEACNRLCRQVHGHDRGAELRDAIADGTAVVVESDGRVSGYATIIGFFGHAVGETNRDLKALIAAAEAFAGPGFLLPMRNAELFRWCLQHRLRVTQTVTLMSKGLYNEPAGAFLPSILY